MIWYANGEIPIGAGVIDPSNWPMESAGRARAQAERERSCAVTQVTFCRPIIQESPSHIFFFFFFFCVFVCLSYLTASLQVQQSRNLPADELHGT